MHVTSAAATKNGVFMTISLLEGPSLGPESAAETTCAQP